MLEGYLLYYKCDTVENKGGMQGIWSIGQVSFVLLIDDPFPHLVGGFKGRGCQKCIVCEMICKYCGFGLYE